MKWGDHVALVVGALSSVFVAARLLFVARFDANTAATILDVVGVGTVIAGTTLSLLPWAVALATLAVSVFLHLDPELSPFRRETSRVLLLLLLGADLALLAPPLAVGVLLVVLVMLTRWHTLGRFDVRAAVTSSRLLRAELRVLVVLVVLGPVVLQRPWLPIEHVRLTSGRDLVGYVLGEREGQLALLDEGTRTVTLAPPAAIATRTICSGPTARPGPAGRLPQLQFSGSLLGEVLYGDAVPSYPTCPEVAPADPANGAPTGRADPAPPATPSPGPTGVPGG